MEKISKVNGCGKYRNVVFTINNPTDEDRKYLTLENFKYLVYGEEVGDSGTPHLQGYGELYCQLRLKGIHRFLPRAAIYARKGEQSAAIFYCKKQQDYTEIGEKSVQGKRNDLSTQCFGLVSTGWPSTITPTTPIYVGDIIQTYYVIFRGPKHPSETA